MNYKFSFIIATVDRDKELQSCINAIEKAYECVKSADIEITVVFQDRKENRTIKTNYPELITFYFLDKRGLSLARNFGIKKTTGEYLVFLDDDTIIQEDFIAMLLKNIPVTGASAFCCRDIDPVKNRFYSGRFLKNNPKYLNHFKFVYFLGYAHIVKRSKMEKIGSYDERFGVGAKYGGAEESDIFFRLKHRNEKIVYLADLVVYHPIGSVTSERKRFNYYYATGAMLVKEMTLDKRHFYIYLFIIIEILFKSSLRTLQTIFFPKSIEAKNLIFRPRSVLTGMIKGIRDYMKEDAVCIHN